MALICLERQVWRGDYVGGSAFWDFSPVDQNRGCLAPGSVVAAGPRAFYLAEDGFRMTDGINSVPIGEERINRTFFADVDLNYPNSISAEVSPRRPEVMWIYPGSGHSAGVPNKWLIYNWVLDRWSHGEDDLEWVVRTLPPGFSMDELDAEIGPDLDDDYVENPPGTYKESLDSSFYSGFPWDIGAYNTAHTLGTFSGQPNEALVETGDFEITPNRRSFVSGVRPVVGHMTVYASIGAMSTHDETPVFTSEVTPTDATGQCDFRVDARYHRAKFRVPMPDEDDEYVGFDVTAVPAGDR
jgi:hypothetical protein